MTQNSVLAATEATLSAEATPSAEVSNLPAVHVLPDNPLYFLKTLKEKVQLLVTRNTSAQADLLLTFAQKRLAEAAKVAEKGKVHISEKLFESFGQDIKAAQEKIAQARARGERTYNLLIKLQETVAYQKSVIEELREEVEGLDHFLVEIDQGLGASPSATPSAATRGKIQPGVGIFDWLKSLFGKKEVLSPLAR